ARGISARHRLFLAVELEPFLSFGERGDPGIPHVVRAIAREERLVLGPRLAAEPAEARLAVGEMGLPCDLDRPGSGSGQDLADRMEFPVGLLLVFENMESRRLRLDPAVDLECAERARHRIHVAGDVGHLGTDEIEPVVRIAAHGVSDARNPDRRMDAILTLSHGVPSERWAPGGTMKSGPALRLYFARQTAGFGSVIGPDTATKGSPVQRADESRQASSAQRFANLRHSPMPPPCETSPSLSMR